MSLRIPLSLLLFCGLVVPALAQDLNSTRIRGTVERIDGSILTVRNRDGKDVAVKLADNATVTGVMPIDLNAIQPNSYVGTAATKQANGTLRAIEVHVFPEASRGAGEGHRPMDIEPGSTMTNATVGTVAQTANGRELTLNYKGGTQLVVVPPGTPIITFTAADRSWLVNGAKVTLQGRPGTDGMLSASRVQVGKDGYTPPL